MAEKGLPCPNCGEDDSRVMQSWPSDEFGGCYRRRRKCNRCHTLFHTAELDTAVLTALEGGYDT